MISNAIKQKAQQIKLVIFDVDGVLTDGGLYYGAEGEAFKRFNVKDGVGLKLLQQTGFSVAIISAKDSAPLKKRIKDLQIVHAVLGCKDKLEAATGLAEKLGITMDEVAFCGDDMVDLKVMAKAGLSIAPKDAYHMVADVADWTTESLGGQGVAREVADVLIAVNGSLKEAYIATMLPEFESSNYLDSIKE
ncbi:HAD-IIIA family hydrolase [Bermanella marisrubri]|uniref:3-deoxy-D-manno-octulosonate 8-phosphate phosphatase KdsC n=1 Tax=Bermanella marisrubri TaxID=207949 RepID=Q1MXV0_9GAMM|nr:HAD-IIIA family hydrolase [Bermanella marisrubri]EAT10787.1 HAD-superfamily hydrolase subfamily IIIA:Phosphatase kdsC [Oceanobacter sp. RED65] [Bermanella marisrubri]QIZ84249.1 HAD-IIIA family hydrolase [Bermanella marisrubri]